MTSGPGLETSPCRVVLDQRHAVLTRIRQVGQQHIVAQRPGFHAHVAVDGAVDGGQTGLELAEDHALLHEAIVRTGILERQSSIAKGPVLAFETAGEGSGYLGGQCRTDHARARQRRAVSDAVRTWQARIALLIEYALRPVEAWMIGPEREMQLELLQIEGDQVVKSASFGGIERVHSAAEAAEDRLRHGARPHDAQEFAGRGVERIPKPQHQILGRVRGRCPNVPETLQSVYPRIAPVPLPDRPAGRAGLDVTAWSAPISA